MTETLALKDGSQIDVNLLPNDLMVWKAHWRAELWDADGWKSGKPPLKTVDQDGNLLVLGGASLMWEYAIGNGSTAAASAKKYVNATAARLVAVPFTPHRGARITFVIIQGGLGGFAITWAAAYKKTWSDTGNATGTRSSISYIYDGTNWNQDGAQAPYV